MKANLEGNPVHQTHLRPAILTRSIASVVRRPALRTLVAVGVCAAFGGVDAGEPATRVSALSKHSGKDSYLAYPAISVPSGAFSSSYAPPPPTPRTMPTSLSTAGWSAAVSETVVEQVTVPEPAPEAEPETEISPKPKARPAPPRKPAAGAAQMERAPAVTPAKRKQAAVVAEEETAAPAPKPRARPKTVEPEVEAPGPAKPRAKPQATVETAAADAAPKPRVKAKAAAEEPEPKPRVKSTASAATAAEEPAPKPRVRAKADAATEYAGEPAPKPRFRVRAEAPMDDKAVHDLAPVEPEPSRLRVVGSAGYYSRYMFRGLDVGYRTGIDAGNDSAFFASNAAVSLGGFTVGFWYEHSLDSYVPGGAGFDKSFGNLRDPLDFKTPQRERYQEYDLFANYTFRLTPELALTTGMNFYWFSDGRFWANSGKSVEKTVEAAASLNYTGIPYLNQTLSYYYDFDAFNGGYLEYKLATKPIELVSSGDFAIALIPSVVVSYDWSYNGSNDGWNHIEPGIDMPIRLADGLTLNLGARYSADLGDSSVGGNGQAVDRTDDRFWFSAAFQYAFPTGRGDQLEYAGKDGKSLMEKEIAPPEHRPWELSVGAGVRTIESSFAVDPESYRFDQQRGGGDLFFANGRRDAHYLDGSVFGGSDGSPNADIQRRFFGTSSFSFQNQSQISNNGPTTNRQVTYRSERYAYPEKRDGFNESHNDPTVYPYVKLSREIFRSEPVKLDIGLSYSYSHGEMDSGSRLVGFAQEEMTRYFFTYDFDEILSNPRSNPRAPFSNYGRSYTNAATSYSVIYDAPKFKNFVETFTGGLITVPLAPPQSSRMMTTTTVATFRGATLETDLHNAAIPISVSVDLSPRVHASLSFGPTLNVLDSDLKTETFHQLLEGFVPDEGGASKATRARPYFTPTGSVISLNPTGNINAQGGIIPAYTAFVAAPPGAAALGGSGGGQAASLPATQATSGGGKGSSEGRSRKLPGRTIRHDVKRSSAQDTEIGVFGQLGVQLDLDSDRRWFVDLYARYEYAPEFSLNDGVTSTSIDVSSWGGGVGIGFRF